MKEKEKIEDNLSLWMIKKTMRGENIIEQHILDINIRTTSIINVCERQR
jgi:hypothetical protein